MGGERTSKVRHPEWGRTNIRSFKPAHIETHVRLIGTPVGLIGTHVGSMRLFGYQHVGIGNVKVLCSGGI